LCGAPSVVVDASSVMDASDVLKAIQEAFDGVPRSEVSLRQFRLTDLKGMAGTITPDEWAEAGRQRIDTRWQDIPDTEIKECDCVLAHMQASEFQYYLPAYMQHAVRNARLPIWESDILGMTVSALYPSTKDVSLRHYALAQYSLLTRAQRQAIVQFLRFVADNADFVQRPHAQKALERHWTDEVVDDGFDTSVLVLPK
jgi:hypothetical protein